MDYFVGIDIGGTKCAAALGESTKENGILILDKRAFPTDAQEGFRPTFETICGAVQTILEQNSVVTKHIHRIGISCGGPLDSEKGLILSPPNLIGWDDIPIVALMEARFGIPARLQNDANACALAEWKFGAAKGCSNAVFLTFGTGMGAGLILNGKLYGGANDMAGEIGHIRMAEHGPVGYGKAGSFEGFCSGGGIAQLAGAMALEKLQAGEKTGYCASIGTLDEITAKTVAQAANAGDETAKEVYRVCGRFLGRGLSVLIDLLNPEIIVLGSVYARSEALLRGAAMEVIQKEALSRSLNVCKIVPAGLGEEIGDYAALAVAVYET